MQEIFGGNIIEIGTTDYLTTKCFFNTNFEDIMEENGQC